MKIDILTLFPQVFEYFNYSILKRAIDKELLNINLVNIRDFTKDKHGKVDDTPFGGGAGMVMACQPLFDAINSVKTKNSKIIYLSPKGNVFKQSKCKELAKLEHLILICGHYEGIDERILQIFNIEEISIGDYVLTGGELPAMVIVDAVSRYVEGVITKQSTEEESFANGLLEYPQYTKPQDFLGYKVPDVLINGNHQKIKQWRDEMSLKITKERRPDLLKDKN